MSATGWQEDSSDLHFRQWFVHPGIRYKENVWELWLDHVDPVEYTEDSLQHFVDYTFLSNAQKNLSK